VLLLLLLVLLVAAFPSVLLQAPLLLLFHLMFKRPRHFFFRLMNGLTILDQYNLNSSLMGEHTPVALKSN